VILTGPEICRQVSMGRILIDPFEPKCATSNSYDLHASSPILVYANSVLDPAQENPVLELEVPSSGLVLESDRIYLVGTLERVGSDHFVPIVKGRSSAARLGLFSHVTADLIDLGFFGTITLQVHAVQPVRLYPGASLAQVTFWVPYGDITGYSGKYAGADGPIPSRSWMGWERDRKRFARLVDPEEGTADAGDGSRD
jgi:dCTP deaminase